MQQNIIFAGFGGQGILTAGMLIAYVAYNSDFKVTWFPSYGSEMRGRTANCSVKISDSFIASPYINQMDILFALNEPAIDKFEDRVKEGGFIFVNSSIVSDERIFRAGLNIVRIPIASICDELNNKSAANIVMLGAMMEKNQLVEPDVFKSAMSEYFTTKGKEKFNEMNIKAFDAGYNEATTIVK